MALHHVLREREPNCRAFLVVNSLQPLEHAEELVGVLHLDTHAVVPHEIHTLTLPVLAAHLGLE